MNSFNEQGQNNTKESITRLADEAKVQLSQNKYLLEKVKIFKQQITIVKNFITNYTLNSNQKSNNCNLSLKYREQLFVLNSKLKDELSKNLKKHENILNNLSQDLSDANQTLSQFSIDNFILNNTIFKFDSKIKALSEGIETSKKYDLFREPKRESELETRQSKNTFLVYNLELQQKMLSFCRAYTNYRFKNNKKENLIKKNKKKLAILKRAIKFYCKKLYGDENKILDDIYKKIENNNKGKKDKKKVDIKKRIRTNPQSKNIFPKIDVIKNFFENKKINAIRENKEDNDENSNEQKNENKEDNNNISKDNNNENNDTTLNKTSFINDNDTSLFKNIYNNEENKENENKVNINDNERKKINLLKIDELLDIENIEVENEDIIDNELNSDDETFFEKKIKPKKKICTDFLPNIKKEVPSINLSQIEFNKLKVINEADAYSLQKRNFQQGNINGKIKNMKTQIKILSKKVSMNKKKLDAIHNFIEDVKYNYKLLRPIKVQTSAAGTPVNYIREKLLNIVEESINESEIKEKMFNDNKNKTEKTAVEEGVENEEESVGSDYSDEDNYIEKCENKRFSSEKKENENSNSNKANNFSQKKKIKHKNRDIKTNLISKFESDGKEENKNNIDNDFKEDLLDHIIAQSK